MFTMERTNQAERNYGDRCGQRHNDAITGGLASSAVAPPFPLL